MSDYSEELEVERTMKDRFMSAHPESPFVQERIPGFTGLRYFPINEAMRVSARLVRREEPEEAYLRTNRDGQASMRYIGDLRFTIGRRALALRVFHAGEGVGTSVLIPFRDLTSGAESYGPGRYLTLELNEEDEYDLDFNRAFNPYCAYTEAFECAFPPSENDLAVAITAGERVWAEDHNPRTPSSVVRALTPTRLPAAVRARTETPSSPSRRRPVARSSTSKRRRR